MTEAPKVSQSASAVGSGPVIAAPGRATMAMSVDVEDWFQVENLRTAVSPEAWPRMELRVQRNVEYMLQRMEYSGAKGTFFVLGWIAKRCPHLVQQIAKSGHEIASHGYGHSLVHEQTPAEFKGDVLSTKLLLEDLIGQPILGYRAPNFSITDWALPILLECGIVYDSSSFPSSYHDRYGRLSGLDRDVAVSEIRPGLLEVSLSCLPFAGTRLPWSGGAYFRFMPYDLFRWGVRKIAASQSSYVFYIHPWELDAGQPRVRGIPLGHRLRHYTNLARSQRRWEQLLGDFTWVRIRDLLDHAWSTRRR